MADIAAAEKLKLQIDEQADKVRQLKINNSSKVLT